MFLKSLGLHSGYEPLNTSRGRHDGYATLKQSNYRNYYYFLKGGINCVHACTLVIETLLCNCMRNTLPGTARNNYLLSATSMETQRR